MVVGVNDGGGGGCHGNGLLMWVRVAVVVTVAVVGRGQQAWWWLGSAWFGYFLMGLWLDICSVCGGFGVMVVVVWW